MNRHLRSIVLSGLTFGLLGSLQIQAASATRAETLKVIPGFKVELLRTTTTEESSLISMTMDNKGRMIASPQDGLHKMHRFTLGANGQIVPEPLMDLESVGQTIAHIANLPPEANVLFITLMATQMPYVGRG